MWPWPDPRSRSRSRGFWTSANPCMLAVMTAAPLRGFLAIGYILQPYIRQLLAHYNNKPATWPWSGDYMHSLTFHVRHYVVIATKPVHRLQICPTMHNLSATIRIYHQSPFIIITQAKSWYSFYQPMEVESWVDQGSAVWVHSPCPRLQISQWVLWYTSVRGDSQT